MNVCKTLCSTKKKTTNGTLDHVSVIVSVSPFVICTIVRTYVYKIKVKIFIDEI